MCVCVCVCVCVSVCEGFVMVFFPTLKGHSRGSYLVGKNIAFTFCCRNALLCHGHCSCWLCVCVQQIMRVYIR